MPVPLNKLFVQIFCRDVLLLCRQLSDVYQPLLFFLIVTMLFPLAITSDLNILHQIAPGILWMAALFASLLALDHVFYSDYVDGTLAQFYLSSQPLWLIVIAKVLANWVMTSVPLIIITPLLGGVYHIAIHEMMVLLLSLILGTPILSFMGAMVSALIVGLAQRSLLLILLVLPLYIPIVIFGTSAVMLTQSGLPADGLLVWLAAILSLVICFGPWVIAGALRLSLMD